MSEALCALTEARDKPQRVTAEQLPWLGGFTFRPIGCRLRVYFEVARR
jgi:hypothetical protein